MALGGLKPKILLDNSFGIGLVSDELIRVEHGCFGMIVFRLSKAPFAHDLTGRGSEFAGGGWNSKGLPMYYTGASRAHYTAEVAVHTPLGILPKDYVIVEIEIPNDSIEAIEVSESPSNRREFPYLESTKKMEINFLKETHFLF